MFIIKYYYFKNSENTKNKKIVKKLKKSRINKKS